MFRFGRKTPGKKLKKEAKEAEEAAKVDVLEPPTKVPFEEESPLAKAKAEAFKKSHVVKEKGLPSFAEFGTKELNLEAMDDSDEEREETLRAGLKVPGDDDRRRGGRLSAGSDRSPSPRHSAHSRDPSPLGRVSPMPDRHLSPLAERDYNYQQRLSPQHTQASPGYYASPGRDEWAQAQRPVEAIDWRGQDPYMRQPSPNPAYDVRQASPMYPERRRVDSTPLYGDRYGLAPHSTYTAPTPYPDPYRQPVHPPPNWQDRGPQPQYPSPVSDRYYQGYRNGPEYPDPRYPPADPYYSAATPSPGYAPQTPRQPVRSSTYDYVGPQTPAYPPAPPNGADPRGWSAYPPTQYVEPSRPYPQGPSPQPYSHHQRAHTIDAGPPYGQSSSYPPVEPPYQAPPAQYLPSQSSQQHLRSQTWDYGQEPRRRTYSLQPAAPPQPSPSPDPRLRNPVRSQRHSDFSAYDLPRQQEARYQQQQQQQQYAPSPTPSPQKQHQYAPQPTPSPQPPPERERGRVRGRMDSLTAQLEQTHLQSRSPSIEAQLGSASVPQHPAHYSIYHTPSDSRSRDTFDFSSPSPSPTKRSARDIHNTARVEFPQSASRTSLHSLPEVESDPDEYDSDRHSPPALSNFRRKPPPPVPAKTPAPTEYAVQDEYIHEQQHQRYSPEHQHQRYSSEHQHSSDHSERPMGPRKAPRTSVPYTVALKEDSSTLPGEPEEDQPVAGGRSGPNTPHRRRTVVLNGPRGPRSPPNNGVGSPHGRVSLGRA